MSTNTLGLFLRHLALSQEVSRLGGASDHDLLAAYEPGRGQAAFTELMRRHGPMVLRTCCRVLGRGPDAEDAFQATFVLLARKAKQLLREAAGRQSLGGWLHRVAYRTALDLMAKSTCRRVYERQARIMIHPEPDPAAEATWNEIQPILDAELDALPEQSRRLLIACYLEDKTHTEAAAEMGLPLGSVAWRLEKARALLAERLARRGIVVSATLLAVLLEETAKGTGIPAVLLVHTLEAARSFTEQATGIVSDHVARLVKGGLTQMSKGWTQWSMALAGWLGLLGAGLIACQTLKAWPDRTPESEPPATAERPAQERDKPARIDYFGDPLPAGALARMGTTRLRHAGEVTSVLFAPDGETLASRGGDDTVRLWDVTTGKLVRSLKHPLNQLRSVSFTRDGKVLASLTHDHLWLWDVKRGEQLHELELKVEDRAVISLAISSDGKTAASVDTTAEKVDAVIRLWDVVTGEQLRVLQGHRKLIHLLSFSPDNKTLASCASSLAAGNDNVVSLWDVASGKLLHNLEHPLGIMTISFSPDGKTLASGGNDKSKHPLVSEKNNPSAVRLWDVATGKLLRTLEGHQASVQSVSFSPDGKVLASGSFDRTIRLWNLILQRPVYDA